MAHGPAFGCRSACDESSDWLSDVLLDVGARFFFSAATNFTDHDDRVRVRIFVEQAHSIELRGAVDWVTTNTDTSRLAVAALCELVNGFVSQCAGARDYTDATWLVDVARHDADLTFAGCDDTWAVWPDQTSFTVCCIQCFAHFSHVAHWHTFGDADDERDLGCNRFED